MHPSLVTAVKDVQRSSPLGDDCWRTWCGNVNLNEHDPKKVPSEALIAFLSHVEKAHISEEMVVRYQATEKEYLEVKKSPNSVHTFVDLERMKDEIREVYREVGNKTEAEVEQLLAKYSTQVPRVHAAVMEKYRSVSSSHGGEPVSSSQGREPASTSQGGDPNERPGGDPTSDTEEDGGDHTEEKPAAPAIPVQISEHWGQIPNLFFQSAPDFGQPNA